MSAARIEVTQMFSSGAPSQVQRQGGNANKHLPPEPSLHEHHLKLERVYSPEGVALEALVPSDNAFACKDPNAPALVLVPGLGMDGWGFLRQLPLAAMSHLHLFQMPNDPAPNEQGLGHFARHVEDYIRARGLDRHPGGVVVGGCSMGGAVSLHLATRGNIALKGLALIGTFGHCRHIPMWQRVAAPLSWVLPLHRSRFIARHVVKKTKYFGAVSPEEADFLCNWKVERTQRYFGRAVMALTRQKQLEAARDLKLPTLVTHGRYDYVLPFAAGEELAQTIPNAEWLPLEDAGHALFFTHAPAVNQALAKLLVPARSVAAAISA